jgi:hypothetical protein
MWRVDLAQLEEGATVRTEVDAGELLRELVFWAAFFVAAYRWLPAFLDLKRTEIAEDIRNSKPSS